MRESGASVIGKKVLGPEVNDSDATITGFVLQQVTKKDKKNDYES